VGGADPRDHFRRDLFLVGALISFWHTLFIVVPEMFFAQLYCARAK
jgi:hypothetical protein